MKLPKIKKSNLLFRKGHTIFFPDDSELCNKGFMELLTAIYQKKIKVTNPHKILLELTEISDKLAYIKSRKKP